LGPALIDDDRRRTDRTGHGEGVVARRIHAVIAIVRQPAAADTGEPVTRRRRGAGVAAEAHIGRGGRVARENEVAATVTGEPGEKSVRQGDRAGGSGAGVLVDHHDGSVQQAPRIGAAVIGDGVGGVAAGLHQAGDVVAFVAEVDVVHLHAGRIVRRVVPGYRQVGITGVGTIDRVAVDVITAVTGTIITLHQLHRLQVSRHHIGARWNAGQVDGSVAAARIVRKPSRGAGGIAITNAGP